MYRKLKIWKERHGRNPTKRKKGKEGYSKRRVFVFLLTTINAVFVTDIYPTGTYGLLLF